MNLPAHSLVLADDHVLVRAGIRALLDTLDACRVVAECSDGFETIAATQRTRPDVLVLDLTLPGLNGFEVLDQVRRMELPTRVLVLSMHRGSEYVARALHAGARGYLPKASAADELTQALETLLMGRRFLGQGIDVAVVERMLENWQGERPELASLTPRQRQILQLIAEGRPTREIAEVLEVGVKTVETHRIALMKRLGIHDVAGLVRFALRNGLISPGD